MRLLSGRRRRNRERGQSLVEFALILQVLLVLTLTVAEIGVAISQNMSLEVATREGARVGASMVNGGGAPGCGSGLSPNWQTVDPAIIASVERALTSTGGGVDLTRVDWIHIYKSNSSGGEATVNVWRPGAGPVVDGRALHFYEASSPWDACMRTSTLPADSIGVSLSYRYRLFTPLAAISGLFATNEITMVDRTVMALQPTS